MCSVDAVRRLGTLPRLSWLILTRLQLTDAHVQALCSAIGGENNDTSGKTNIKSPLRTLEIHKTRRVTKVAWQALLQLVQTHVHLETVDMYCKADAHDIREQVMVYLKLNRQGRRQALRQATNTDDWIRVVHKHFIDDPAALQVLVRDSPWICLRRPRLTTTTME